MFLSKKTFKYKCSSLIYLKIKYRIIYYSNMNIANSIRKNYYLIPKSFVQKLTVCGISCVVFHIGNKWNIYDKLSKKIEERVSYEEMKKACLNFVGEMLFDNFAKINFSKCFNDILNKPEISSNEEREMVMKNQIVQDFLKKVLDDKNKMDEIKKKFMENLKRGDMIQNIPNTHEFQEEISIFLRELLTSNEVVSIFCEMIDNNSRKIVNSKEFNRNISFFTDKLLQDERIKRYTCNRLEDYISNRKLESDEMKKVNKELIEMINNL
jgi:hypothetical protein